MEINSLAVLSGLSSFSWEKYSAALEAKGYTVKLKMDASVTVRGYTIQSGNSVYKSSVIGRELTPAKIQETWEKMRPENRFAQMTSKEQIAFILSDEGRDFSYSFGFNVDGKGYPISVTGRAVKALIMAALFGVQVAAISKHIKHVLAENELDARVVVSKMEITTPHGAMEGKTRKNIARFAE